MSDAIQYLVASAVAALSPLTQTSCEPPSEPPGYGADAASDISTYRLWIDAFAPRRAARLQEVTRALEGVTSPPTISILVPIYQPELPMLERCVASIRDQPYGGWEACFALDGPADVAVETYLRTLTVTDARFRLRSLTSNQGISAATNEAARSASGGLLAFLDQDDELADGVLSEVALASVERPDADVIYTDQDKIEDDGRAEPYFKPDWSPDLLLSNMYLGHLLVVRRALFDELGGFRSEFDGSQDYDLALRATEQARTIVHLPVVGYHWRATSGSTAAAYQAKPAADDAARRALEAAMARREEPATVEPGLWEGTFRVRREIRGEPFVRVIIPFHDGADLLRRCVDSLERTAGYEHWRAVLVDNRSWEPETRAVLRRIEGDPRFELSSFDGAFNWSAINNAAARERPSDLYLFMNSDIEGRGNGWMAAMVEHAQRAEVGAVGARLLYPEGLVQHAGVVMGLGGGVAWHAFCFCPEEKPGYFAHAKLIRNYTGVTGACMMVRHDVFEEMHGFDEELAVAYNDVDFCLRLREAGYLVVYTPFAELTHYEGATRGKAAFEHEETSMMMKRWSHVVRGDPYFNRNLNPLRSECQLSIDLEERDLWAHLE